MRMAGRFSRRVRAFAKAHQIPVIDCRRGERKHEIAEAYLATHAVERGLFLILVARAVAPVWEVERSRTGTIRRLAKKKPYVNHYSFRYTYSVYQAEYSRNFLFQVGGQMEAVFQQLVDRTRARLDVPHVKTLFGAKQRPRQRARTPTPRLAVAVETPTYHRTVFKVEFGALHLKAYTKGERVLRFEAVVHNTRDLGCGRVVTRFPAIVARRQGLLERFLTMLHCVDAAFIADTTLDDLPQPAQVGKTRVGGVDPNKPRMRAVLAAVLALAPAPGGFRVAAFMAKVQVIAGQPGAAYGPRQAAYDLKKLRGKHLIMRLGASRRYQAPPDAVRTIAALLILRDHVIRPLLAGMRTRRVGRKPKTWTVIDTHYETLRLDLRHLFQDLGIAA
jgi:hypothetical protein